MAFFRLVSADPDLLLIRGVHEGQELTCKRVNSASDPDGLILGFSSLKLSPLGRGAPLEGGHKEGELHPFVCE